jgi:hypothetical protein
MATITPATTYPAGALNIAGHNANVFSTTAGQGVMSEPNGNLGIANLDPAFVVRDEHVMSEEAVMAKAEGLTVPMDVYNNAFAMREEDDPVFVPIGGLCQRVYIPFDVSAVVWQWSFYVAVWRPFIVQAFEEQLLGADIPQVSVRLFIDGTEYPAFRRPLPVSADLWLSNTVGVDNGGSASSQINYENVSAVWYDITKLQTSVTAGYHELNVKLYMPRVHFNDAEDETQTQIGVTRFATTPENDGDTTVISTVHTRVTLGSRSVRFVMFK